MKLLGACLQRSFTRGMPLWPAPTCAEGISQEEMLAFLFGAARESEELAKRVSRDFNLRELFNL